MPQTSPDENERINFRDVPMLLLTAAPFVAIGFGFVAMGAYLSLQTRLRMVEKMGVEGALFWQIVGWIVVIWLWHRLFIKAGALMSGAFPGAPAAIVTFAVAAYFVGWLVFVAGTLCGVSGY